MSLAVTNISAVGRFVLYLVVWSDNDVYTKVRKKWMYLYRAIDSDRNALDFLLTARRNAPAAERFLRKVILKAYTHNPRVINVDKPPAYPKAVEPLQKDEDLPERSKLRAVKYLNKMKIAVSDIRNAIEQLLKQVSLDISEYGRAV
ncbi:MAG: DDE-type integrase/transposase/recombinase [Cyanobacteria bacterium P01_A01_bin.17]